MTEQFANNASTTLNGTINNSTTTVVVTNGAVFSQSGTFRVIVESEIMIVSAISGNTLTVTRGQEGTSAASHTTGTTITQIVTAGAIAQLKADTSVGVMRAGSGDPNTNPSFVQGKNSGGATVTTTSSVTAGNLLVVFVQCETNNPIASPPTDNFLTSYTLIASITTGASQVYGGVYAGIAPSSGILTVTGHQAGSSFLRTSVGEYKNANATVDSFSSGTAVNTLNVTISEANSLVVAVVGDFSSSSTFTAGTNFSFDFFGNGSDSTFYEHAVTSAIGTFAAAYTSTHGTAGNIEFAIVFHPTGTTTVGQDGDFYIDTINKKLYGPRTSGAYPLIGTLT